MKKSKIYGLMDLFSKLMVINFIWFLTLISGMVVFTVFPATAALFSTIRILLENSVSYSEITRLYLSYLKRNFIKFSIIGITSVLFFLILISNYIFIFNLRDVTFIKLFLQPVMIFIGLCAGIIFINLFMINAYEDMSMKDLVLSTFYKSIGFPFNGILRLIILCMFIVIIIMFPGLLPIISINMFAVISIWVYPKPQLQKG